VHPPELWWDKFLRNTGRCIPNKAQSPAALDAWRVWEQCAGLSLQQQELCLDPERSVRMFDLATIGNATLSCTRVERSKLAGDGVVLIEAMRSTGLDRWIHFYHMHHLVGRTATLLRRHMLLRWNGMQMQFQLQASAMACQSAWGAQCSRDTDEMTILAISGQ